jgi:purine nucleosidase
VSAIVSAGIDLYDALLGTPLCEMHDPLAAALVFEPDLADWVTGSVRVRLQGDERGRTVLDDRAGQGAGPECRVALGIDVSRARSTLLAALGALTDR